MLRFVRSWLVVLVVLVVLVFVLERPARAADAPAPPAELPGTTSPTAFFAELGLGVRSLRLDDGLVLRGNRPGSRFAIAGSELPPSAMFDTTLRLGLRYRGLVVGGGFSLAVADGGAVGTARPLGDLEVRTNGFAVAGGIFATAGYRYQRGAFAGRLEGVVGAEILGIGLERPSYPETKITYANVVRPIVAPRIAFERAFDDVAIGVFVQPEILAPGTITFGLTITPWVGLSSSPRTPPRTATR